MADLQLYLLILRIPGLRTAEKSGLAGKFDSYGDLSALSKNDIEAIIGRRLEEPWEMDEIRRMAADDHAAAKRAGIKMVCLGDPGYPPLLREIYDPPVVIFYRGVLPDPEQPLAAMVGTRQPSSGAASFAYKMGRDLGDYGIPVVSGLALGIDALSHRGNTDAHAPAAAVLGSGVDQVYPSSNRALAKRILDNGGILLSEYPPEMGPRKWHFPARNRIISALARGTVIVEAPEKSGALITAGFALEQGRDLWVTSIGVNSFRGKGTAKLAADGAGVIDNALDILAEWGLSADKNPGLGFADRIDPDDISGNPETGRSLASALARSLKIEEILEYK